MRVGSTTKAVQTGQLENIPMRLVAFDRVHLVNLITFVTHERHGISRGFRFFL